MIYNPYEIIVIPFPFTDRVQSKKRPALVLTSQTYQKNTGHIVLCMITSAQHKCNIFDIPLINLENTGLSKPSLIRFKIFTLDQRLIVRSIGRISDDIQEEVKMKLGDIL